MTPRRPTSSAGPRRERWFSGLFWLCAVAACAWLWGKPLVRPLIAASAYARVESHAPLLREVAREFELDPNLLAGVVLAESSGRVDAVSRAGALGLFQLMPPTARERAALLGLEAPTRAELLSDAALNARLGASYLRWLLERYGGDQEVALAAYNAGPGRVDGWIKEHGSAAAWRAAREASSPVLAYARRVLAQRDSFVRRGAVQVLFDHPPAPAAFASSPTFVGPPAPWRPARDWPAAR